MITYEKMIMVFVMSTGWTVLAITRVATMNDMAHWQETMRPLYVEGGTMVILFREIGVE